MIWFGLGLTNRFVLVRGAASMPTAQAASFETRFAGAGSLETSRMMSTHDADLDWLAGRALSDGTTRTRPVTLRYVTSRTLFDFARDHGRKPRMPFDVSAHGSDRVRHDNVGSHPIRHFNPVRHRATSCRTRSDVTFCGTVSGSIRCHLMPDRIGSDRTSLDLRSNP